MDKQAASQALIYLVVIALFLRRTLTTQTMRVNVLPVIAILFVVIGGLGIAYSPRTPYQIVAVAIGVVLGIILGYFRGRHSHVTPGPKPGTIRVKASPVLAAVIIAALVIRLGVRYAFVNDPLTGFAISDGTIAFAVLSVAVARMMLFFAARRVIAPAV
jgi:hypothetical protein